MSQMASASYGNRQGRRDYFSFSDLGGRDPSSDPNQPGEEDLDDVLDYEQALGSRRIPMNSTLMTNQVPAQFASTDRKRNGRDRRAGIPEQMRHGQRATATAPVSYRDRDVTLSTQTESIVDDEEGENNVIPGVGAGHVRHGRNALDGTDVNARLLRDLNVHHPSPATAAKHRQLFARPTALHNDSEDSESVAESSSQSTVSQSDVGARSNPFVRNARAFNESTGNHQGFMNSPRREVPVRNVSEPVRNARPGLPQGWEQGFDELVKARKSSVHSFVPATDGAESGSNESGYAAGRHPQARYDRKPASGTEASTSGETLVDDGPRAGMNVRSAKYDGIRLPSGQGMGKGIPRSGFSMPQDVSGITQALESPVKVKLGVEHREVVPDRIQAFAVPAVQNRLRAFDDINSYIYQMEKKVDRVEDMSQNAVKEVDSLRKEWRELHERKQQSPFKGRKPYTQSTSQRGRQHEEQTDSGREEARHFRQHLAGARQMASEIGESMEYYKSTLAALRKEEMLLIEREKNRNNERQQAHQHRAVERRSAEDEVEDVDSLRAQVEAVAKQVERLRVMVVHKDGVKQHIYPASSPIKPSYRRSIGVGNDNPFVQRRKVSGESAKSGSSNVRVTSHAGKSPLLQHQQDDEGIRYDGVSHHGDGAAPTSRNDDRQADGMDNVSHIAELRAEQAEDRAAGHQEVRHDREHDAEHCLHCIRQSEKERRKSARKQAASMFGSGSQAKQRNPSSSSSEDVETHARALLEQALQELNGAVDSRVTPVLLRLAEKQRSLLDRTIGEEMDEFYHEKCTYLELAEEFKSFSPDLNSAKRRILSEHIMIAVERLEMRADRIERLRAALAATLPNDLSSQNRRQSAVPSSRASTAKRARNTPPIVDGDVQRSDEDELYDRLFAN